LNKPFFSFIARIGRLLVKAWHFSGAGKRYAPGEV
jgi:hypothetical protein